MPGETVYLEASERTQDLLNIKWALRSAGYTIASTWHDVDSVTWPPFRDHWNAIGMQQLQFCDALVVVCGTDCQTVPELAMMAGFALARGIRVFWIGTPIEAMNGFRAIVQFDSTEKFQRQILSAPHSDNDGANKKLAA